MQLGVNWCHCGELWTVNLTWREEAFYFLQTLTPPNRHGSITKMCIGMSSVGTEELSHWCLGGMQKIHIEKYTLRVPAASLPCLLKGDNVLTGNLVLVYAVSFNLAFSYKGSRCTCSSHTYIYYILYVVIHSVCEYPWSGTDNDPVTEEEMKTLKIKQLSQAWRHTSLISLL